MPMVNVVRCFLPRARGVFFFFFIFSYGFSRFDKVCPYVTVITVI